MCSTPGIKSVFPIGLRRSVINTQAVTCQPGYGCLHCRLPASYCKGAPQFVTPDEREMLINAGLSHRIRGKNKKTDSAATESARSKNLG